MSRRLLFASLSFVALLAGCAHPPPTPPPTAAEIIRQRYDAVTPSLVAVDYVWQNELGRRELIRAGTIVGDDGLVMFPISLVDLQIPDEQMKEFKIIVPRYPNDPEEIDAVFQGRDERTDLAFVKTKVPQHWKSVKFEENPPNVGDEVYSVGILPKAAGYKSYLMNGSTAALLRGEMPQIVVDGALSAVGSPVYNQAGQAIGLVVYQPGQPLLLNNESESLSAIQSPPKIFTPTRFFEQSFSDLPTPEKPIRLPWIGVPQLTGLTKDVAEVFNLKDQPAIQVGEVIHDTPAEQAGLKQGDIIVKMNGQPLERGDEPEELPQILRRQILRMKPGDKVVFSVLRRRGQPLKDITVTLAEQPPRPNSAKRYFADDLGFAVRNVVFVDTYARRLPPDAKGVIVALLRPQGSAESGGLKDSDMIQRLNGEPVTDVDEFRDAYEKLRADKPREDVVLVVLREGREDTIRIEPPQ